MNRRHCLLSLLAAATPLLAPDRLLSQQTTDGRATLRERLKAGLLCRRDEEFAFVNQVADLVDQKILTEALVLSTYKWAVEQRPQFPFYYFQYGIRKRAAAIGVNV